MPSTISEYVRDLLATALWSTSDDDGPLDARHDIEHFSPDALTQAQAMVDRFLMLAGDTLPHALEYTGYDMGRVMHDLWLTSAGHGAGFWDGDWGSYGDALTRACDRNGTADIYAGDDGLLYLL